MRTSISHLKRTAYHRAICYQCSWTIEVIRFLERLDKNPVEERAITKEVLKQMSEYDLPVDKGINYYSVMTQRSIQKLSGLGAVHVRTENPNKNRLGRPRTRMVYLNKNF